ncbi:MAG: zinc-dependent alcohol dehydrogenase family protein [Candidatus Marinimicrobia bacterium]|nr:zinc-dependent alcohol dehydrogenase family protein [Candidatus Neomarinimicrobiota bacterium]
MRAAVYNEFQKPLSIQIVPDPTPSEGGVVIRVKATGICRSDWHGWMGHDPDIRLPHVPGHELAGVIEATGKGVVRWNIGDRVTLPFVCGCGNCPQCASRNHQVCDRQFQPGFTHWGSFAEYVAVDYANINLVQLPDEINFVTAASLGCRFVTSFRAIVDQGKVSTGQWIAVHGCGGVGLSAIMIASALGAHVVAVDINEEKLAFARSIGAAVTVNATNTKDVVENIKDITEGGAHVSIDALGSRDTCFNSIASLRKRGKHIQVGLMVGNHSHPAVPMEKIIANELEIIGSHGMQAHKYPAMMAMIQAGKLSPEKLIGKTISLDESLNELANMDNFSGTGVTIIDKF